MTPEWWAEVAGLLLPLLGVDVVAEAKGFTARSSSDPERFFYACESSLIPVECFTRYGTVFQLPMGAEEAANHFFVDYLKLLAWFEEKRRG